MFLLNKLTKKNLLLNKKRSAVTILGIILSVALITALSSLYSSFIATSINYETSIKGNYHVLFSKLNALDVDDLKNNIKIDNISIVNNLGYAYLNESKNEMKPYLYVKEFDKETFNKLNVELLDGRLPKNNKEIVIPKHLKTNGKVDYKIGDTLSINIGKRVSENYELTQENSYSIDNFEEIINSVLHEYKIVGIIDRPVGVIEPYSAPGYTLISYFDDKNITSNNLDVFVSYNEEGLKNHYKTTANILGVSEKSFKVLSDEDVYYNEKEIENASNDMQNAKFKVRSNNYLIKLQTNPLSISSNRSLGIIVLIVALIIVGSSVFCIKNSFDISITEKVKQYGMLKSIGATKKQIKKNVLYESFILGLIAIPLGVLSGMLAAYILIKISNYLLVDEADFASLLTFAISFKTIILSILIGSVTIYLSAIKSARKASNTSPIELIRNSGNIKLNKKKLRIPKFINKVFGIGGVISYKNIKRNKRKLRTTIISLTISIATFIALFYFTSEMRNMVKSEFVTTSYNYYYIAPNDVNYDKVVKTTKIDGVKNSSIVRMTGINIIKPKLSSEYIKYDTYSYESKDSDYISVDVIGKDAYTKYIKDLGISYSDIKDKAILIDNCVEFVSDNGNNKITNYRKYDYVVGDKINGDLYLSDRGNDVINKDIEIGYITSKTPFGLEDGPAGSRINNAVLIVSDEYFEDNGINPNNYLVYFDANFNGSFKDEVEKIVGKDVIEFVDLAEVKKQSDNILLLVNIFLYGFIIVITLIGITNIFNTITTNMELRRQEFAMLKSVGMTRKEFNRMINLESIFIGVKSLFYGVSLGSILSVLIFKYTQSYYGFVYPYKAVIISVVVVLLLIYTLMKYSIKKINKQNVIETIRNENI